MHSSCCVLSSTSCTVLPDSGSRSSAALRAGARSGLKLLEHVLSNLDSHLPSGARSAGFGCDIAQSWISKPPYCQKSPSADPKV
jgi:hypothetical protein